MRVPRETVHALVVAAACGAPPVESTTILAEDGTTSLANASTSDASIDPSTTDPSSHSSTIEPSTSTAAPITESSGSTDADPDSSEVGSETGDATCTLMLHEVLYDPDSGRFDDGYEWVELFNPCQHSISLSGHQLKWGGDGYVNDAQLSGDVAPGACVVIGGPLSERTNDFPSVDFALNFAPDLENGGAAADAIALFGPDDDVEPIDALIYGDENFDFIDEAGVMGAPDVGDVARGYSAARVDASPDAGWTGTNAPTPNVCPNTGL